MSMEARSQAQSQQLWQQQMQSYSDKLAQTQSFEIAGRITKLTGLVMEAVGIRLPVGSACTVPLGEGSKVDAEVVGFDGERLLLMPQSSVDGIRSEEHTSELQSLMRTSYAVFCFT